jgi:hypothetical protein
MIKIYSTIIVSLFVGLMAAAQVTYNGNGNTGFGGPVGNGTLEFNDDGTTVTGTFTRGGGDFNDTMVIYIDTGADGRANTDGLEDFQDANRRAISNTNSGAINFPPGFEATYAIAINSGFGGLWEVPATGTIGNDGLPFVDPVNTAFGNADASFTFDFDWTEIGLTATDTREFGFVITYGNPNSNGSEMFSSDEAFGNGIAAGNPGLNAMTYTQYFDYPNDRVLGIATSAVAGFWDNDLVWTNGNPPGNEDQITIQHAIITDVPITVNNAITVDSGSSLTIAADQVMNLGGSLTNNGTVRFASSANGTAQLLDGASAMITGDITVERFIPAETENKRAFRFLSSSVSSTESIFENWQNGGTELVGVGTDITGSDTGANGFDQTATGAPSMFTFDNTDTSANQQVAWQPVSNTDMLQLQAGTAYRLFVRGDRRYDLSSNPVDDPNSNTALRATGTPVLAEPSVDVNPTAGLFSLVGNPYQAVVDFELLPKSNVNPNFVYVWQVGADPDPDVRGSYVTVDVTGAEEPLQFIQPGQSFFVNTVNDGPASITFNRAAKTPAQTDLTVFSTDDTPAISIDLKSVRANGDTFSSDKLKIKFNGDNNVDVNDAQKLFNPRENISRKVGSSTFLSIESRDLPQDQEVLQLDTRQYKYTNYQLDIDLSNMESQATTFFVDAFKGDETLLTNGTNRIDFTVDGTQNGSVDPNRFSLRFDKSTAGVEDENITWSLYPNPSIDGRVFLRVSHWQNADVSVALANMLGQVITSSTASLDSNGGMEVSTNSLSQGVYLLTVERDGTQLTRKLLVE